MKNLQVLLRENVPSLGHIGEVVRVQKPQDPGGQGMAVLFRRLSEPSIKLLDRLCSPAK